MVTVKYGQCKAVKLGFSLEMKIVTESEVIMNTVMRGTKTGKEFKELETCIEQKAREYYKRHKNASENWQEGEIAKVWIDGQGNICIEYKSGKWWHYNEEGEWW